MFNVEKWLSDTAPKIVRENELQEAARILNDRLAHLAKHHDFSVTRRLEVSTSGREVRVQIQRSGKAREWTGTAF